MDDDATRECAAALGRQPEEVVALRNAGDLLPALIARQCAWLETIAEALEILRNERGGRGSGETDSPARVVADFAKVGCAAWGVRNAFTCGDLLRWADGDDGMARPDVQSAVQALVRGDVNAPRLGRALADASRALRRPAGEAWIERAGERGGSALWRFVAPDDEGTRGV